MDTTLKLPVGIEDFQEIRRLGFYYIDKTKLIEQLLEQWGKVNLFYKTATFWKNLKYEYAPLFFLKLEQIRLYLIIFIFQKEKIFAKNIWESSRLYF